MGNLISRPSCLGQKSKQVRSDENFLKECYQRRKEWPPVEQNGEAKQEEISNQAKNEEIKSSEEEKEKEAERMEEKRQQDCYTPNSDKVLRSSPASTIRSSSTLENAWHGTPSPIKTSRNGTLTRRSVPPDYARSPLAQMDKGAAERRASFQRRDSREGSPWSWKAPMAPREVTEVTEVTETIITEIVEVTEYPPGTKGGDPIVTRTVRVLNGAAKELAEVDKSIN